MVDQSLFNHVGGIEPAAGSKFHPLSKKEIAKVEEICDTNLPESYRWFLENFGAFTTKDYVGYSSIEPLSPSPKNPWSGILSHFFGNPQNDFPHFVPLTWYIETLRDRMPKSMIPIGTDGGGNMICLGISGDQREKIYFWDHNNEWDEDDYLDFGKPVPDDLEFQNVSLIANDFEDFASRLMVID